MARDLHTVAIKNGSNGLALQDRLAFGIYRDLVVPGPVGELTGAILFNPGSGYTSIPTAAAAIGSGATLTPSMAIATSVAATAGTTYAPNDTITLTGGTASQQAILEVLTTKMVTAPAVAAGGSGYLVGDQITLTPGGAVVQVATLSGSAVATVTIVGGGSFTANNVSAGGLTQASTTGVGTGATFTMTAAKYGVNTYAVQNAGSYSVLPANAVAQGSTTGSGTGFTLTVNTWQLQSIAASGGQGYPNGAAITFTGGAGSGALAAGVTNPIGEPVSFQFAGFASYPPAGYSLFLQPNGPCAFSVNSKTQSGGPQVTLFPRASSEPVLATSVDLLVIH